MSTVTCPYCSESAVFTSSTEVYNGRDYGMIYLCRPCEAWVGVHRGTTIPLGRLADAELRRWKRAVHKVFDPIWHKAVARGARKTTARNTSYKWLAFALNIPREECHIGMFDVETCKRAIEIIESATPKRTEAA